MRLSSYSREQLKQMHLPEKNLTRVNPHIKLLFVPQEINKENLAHIKLMYEQIQPDAFDTVVVIESRPGSAAKKLPMPSDKEFKTALGSVPANDKLRNDFADEDDDFFINDEAFGPGNSLYDQLIMLQSVLDNFSVLSIQITDESSFVVKELAFALEEILESKNVLTVVCADLKPEYIAELKNILELAGKEELSGLLNYMNSGRSHVEGLGAFVAGLLVAKKWNLACTFPASEEPNPEENILAGYAEMQHQPEFEQRAGH